MFQSLLSWIGRVNSEEEIKPPIVTSQFQSLLSWIGRVNAAKSSASTRPISGFNPCCRGLVASTTIEEAS